jgi:hypothetical protein
MSQNPFLPMGEAHPDFATNASAEERAAAERAARAGGVVEMADKTAEQHAARERAGRAAERAVDQELERNLAGEIRAKYKIEVTFAGPDEKTHYKGRTVKGPNRLGVRIWESGKRFHGGGDELAFWCLSEDGSKGCGKVIPSDCIRGGVALCPHCNRAVNAELLTDERVGFFSSQSLAQELTKLFRELGSNADIYLKYHKTDIHYIAMERDRGPDVAARLKGMHIYPLKNILVDTSNGADVTKRFYAFVCS